MKKLILLFILFAIKANAQHTFDNHGVNVGINTLHPIKALELHSGDEQITNGDLFLGRYSYFNVDPNNNIRFYNNGGAVFKHYLHPTLNLILDHPIDGYPPFANLALAGHNGYYSIYSRLGDLVLRLGAREANKMILTNEGGGDIVFATGAWAEYNKIRMSIKPNGFVGIGTRNPDELLTVYGTIHAQEVKVDLNGACAPDYVFDPGYKLLPLPKLEDYIKAHRHLPEVPSATELEKNGMSLKEMNLLYLKKIEELTLYLLQQKKQIEKLQKEVNVLKNAHKKSNKNQQ